MTSLKSMAYSSACESTTGRFATTACPREGIFGGCKQGDNIDGSKIVDWYYSGGPDKVKSQCGSATFVPK